MKNDNWPYKYGPPPDELPENDHGWPGSWLLLAFLLIAPLIYFGPQLGAVEAWLFSLYRALDNWVAPIREFVLG
ncbi:hypothetical protein [Allomesorhizobium camelthorni]|uniref:Uncharacterized protein n=1 Tax=Allomesorhizobium camelthorni TaxID=475069 RepID=A0A6G4WP36_9HYPH|nr:hypothetical protein [Mesorhizobium camelthorni]NGO55870.1 hypothetical protein [Mesorhizobium camelthorni]